MRPQSGMSVTDTIGNAISMGAPTYNMGDHRGCYEIYRRTAQSLMARDNLAGTDRMALSSGLRNAEMVS